MNSLFFEPTDGYIYGNEWTSGDIAWWSTRELAEAHQKAIVPFKQLLRRTYVVGDTEPVPTDYI